MRKYELTYLSSLDFSERIKKLIQEQEGILEKPIESSQREERLLTCLEFSLEPGKLKDLEEKIKTEEQILRYMIIIKKKVKQSPIKEKVAQKIVKPKTKKVELKEIDQKIDEILRG